MVIVLVLQLMIDTKTSFTIKKLIDYWLQTDYGSTLNSTIGAKHIVLNSLHWKNIVVHLCLLHAFMVELAVDYIELNNNYS